MSGRARALAVALAAAWCQACNTAFTAHLPRAAGAAASPEQTITHCLASLGFIDESAEELNAASIQKEPALVAVWATPPGSAWSGPSQTVASVRRNQAGWNVTFISRGSPTSAETFSQAFSKCVPAHDATIAIAVESENFLDLR